MLTDRAIINLQPGEKKLKVSDSEGLQLIVLPSGVKTWWFNYRWPRGRTGKQKSMTLGIYPKLGLKEARKRRDEAKELINQGVDPMEDKKEQVRQIEVAEGQTFFALAREWYYRNCADNKKWSSKEHQKHVRERLELYLTGYLDACEDKRGKKHEPGNDRSGKKVGFGKLQVTKITPRDIMSVLIPLEERGAHETSRRLLQTVRSVLGYALALGVIERNIAMDMKGILATRAEKHHASLKDPKQIGPLLNAIDGYKGNPVVRFALQLAPLTFPRPVELRGAEWTEIDFDNARWNIPAHRMKMRLPHIIPLSRQAIEIFKQVQKISGNGKYVFPSAWTTSKTISENTINFALRRLGYSSDKQTGHGFRSMASTLLNEMKYDRDNIEKQLAHVDGGVRGAYNEAEWLEDRRDMMQEWADFLDRLKRGEYAIPRRRVIKLVYE